MQRLRKTWEKETDYLLNTTEYYLYLQNAFHTYANVSFNYEL